MWTKRRKITEATLQLGASVSRVERRHDVKENRDSGVPLGGSCIAGGRLGWEGETSMKSAAGR